MWEYTDKVMEFFYNPRNQGTITQKEEGEKIVTGEVGSIACGDALRLHLKIEEATQTIMDARFQTFGCASAIASSSALTELLKGKKVDEALQINNRDIAEFLGGLPEEKMHCSVMGAEALEAAIFNYKGIPVNNCEEDEGKIVCRCFAVSDTKIKRIIRENKLTSSEQVTNYIKAGGGCSSCLADIDDILAEVNQEKATTVAMAVEIDNVQLPSSSQPAKSLTNLQKITLIERVLEEEVKPVLAEDGGDIELYDVDGDRVQVILKGACSGCPSSTQTLKVAIEARLQERVSPSLVVEEVR